jgi:hypothetical protein
VNKNLHKEMVKYARGTARDVGGSYYDGVRAMRDEPGEVGREVGASTAFVIAWTDAEMKKWGPKHSSSGGSTVTFKNIQLAKKLGSLT